MIDKMNAIVKDLGRFSAVIEEIERENSRLQAKELQEGLTEKEQIQLEVYYHLDNIFYRCRH